jgi:DNA-directed RNA polymerase specialized sigma24 family protein
MKPEKSVYSYFSDKMLLAHLKQGDREAFVEIFERYWKKLYNESYKRLKDKDLVESVVQEVYVTLWKEKESEKIQKILPYLLSSTRAHILKLYRDGKAGPFFERGLNYFMLASIHNGVN